MKKVLCFAALLLLILFITACGSNENGAEDVDARTKATESRFSELEIREYNGIKLDPSVGPRDNSISGIQNVDISNYTLKISGLVNDEVLFNL